MADQLSGRVFDIQRFTVNDGPGIRTEIFLKGCPLSCLWCHSPESQAFAPELAWYEFRCIGLHACGQCLSACPSAALAPGPTVYSETEQTDLQVVRILREHCDGCGRCVAACPARALAMAGVDRTVAELMTIIVRDQAYYQKSGGGVTLSGGEPMGQHRFSAALLGACRERGLHPCLDTTGHAPWSHYELVLPHVDLVLLDIKHMDPERSCRIVGVPNALILENARRMASAGVALQIRIPIIPGYNDAKENLCRTAEFCCDLGVAVRQVQILPYHRLGMAKYERLQRPYPLPDVLPPTDAHMEKYKQLIASYGLEVIVH